jgi:hypothetical protein
MLRLKFEGYGDRLAAEIGGRCAGTRIAPPGIADEILARAGQTDESLDIVRVLSECSQKPLLCRGTKLGPHHPPERSLGTGETLVGPQSYTQPDKSAAARLKEEQDMKRSGDLQRYLGLDQCDVFGPEFLSTRPQVISGRRVRDAQVDPQPPVAAPLNTPINHIAEFGWVSRRKVVRVTPLVRYPSE